MSNPSKSDLEFELALTQGVTEIIGTPRALTVSLLVKYQEWDQLVDLECAPCNYEDAGDFADDYLCTGLLQKSTNLPLGRDLERNAWEQFLAAETVNRQTNDRLDATDYCDHPEWWHRFVKRVDRIMGPMNAEVIGEIQLLCKHGPGTVAGVSGEMVASKKYDCSPTISTELLPFAESLLPMAWFDYASSGKGFIPVDYGTFFTVPKSAKARRGCLYGPNVNQWLTMGIGRYLKKRLRKFGVNLSDQGRNQGLAKWARRWQLATIDLSQASNLLAKKVPQFACDYGWFRLMDLARDSNVKGPDKAIRPLEMFCAMGNGFTFPLETILFLAVVQAIVPRDLWTVCTAYGDDIIVPQEYAAEVITALEYLGFSVNTRKSFLAGRFYESCGTDWFDDQNVRPFFLRKDPKSQIPYEVLAANQLRLWTAKRATLRGCCDIRFKPVWESLVASAPREWRCLRVPPDMGDTGFISSCTEGAHMVRLPHQRDEKHQWVESGWEGFDVRAVAFKPVEVDRRSGGVLLSGLARLSQDPETDLDKLDEYIYRLSQTGWVGDVLPPDLMSMVSTRGREPVRGLYRIARARWVWSREWPDWLVWG